jgi:hypothetical protein
MRELGCWVADKEFGRQQQSREVPSLWPQTMRMVKRRRSYRLRLPPQLQIGRRETAIQSC